MQHSTHGNGKGLDDLYLLPETDQEKDQIKQFLDATNLNYYTSYSNVKGHGWYGKRFFEIPFSESLLPQIEEAVKCK